VVVLVVMVVVVHCVQKKTPVYVFCYISVENV